MLNRTESVDESPPMLPFIRRMRSYASILNGVWIISPFQKFEELGGHRLRLLIHVSGISHTRHDVSPLSTVKLSGRSVSDP